DKISSKRLAKEANVPTVPWIGPIETIAAARRYARPLGYPLLIKATAGGGGHGIRCVRSPRHLAEAFESARSEAFKAFGDPTVFLEQLMPGARHIEVQIIADSCGTTWAVGVRDCTIQRRHQKVLEEAPSPALSPDLELALRNAAVRLSQAAGYQNAGTVEFLYDPRTHQFCFMEMNTRLQVEHPVTECTTQLDLVKMQIHIARGGRLEGEAPATIGHAIEVRLNAEDPDNGFGPAPGKVERFRILTGPGVRIDTGLAEGDTVPPEFDSMIAKIIAHGRTRNEALSRLQRALRESTVVIKGGASNKGFLLELLSRPELQSGEFDVGWLDRLSSNGDHLASRFADVALVQAAIEAYESELAIEKTQFYASARRGRPQVRSEIGRTVNLRYRGHGYALTVYRLGLRQFRVEIDDTSIEAQLDRLGPFESWLTIAGRRFSIVSVAQELNYRIEVDGVSHRVDRDDGGVVHAPAPAVVVSVAVKPGDMVSAGDRLLVVESMKMEMQVTAPFSGKVRRVMAIPNVQVDTGTPLVEMEGVARDQSAGAGQVFFGASFECREGTQDLSHANRGVEALRQLVLGFDVDAKRISVPAPPASHEDANDGIRREDEILDIFVDICSLFQRDPGKTGSSGAEAPSAEMQLFSYLRAIDAGGESLPPSFAERLQRALAHYGVHTLDPCPALEEALMRICKSHQRVEQQITP
ncbi:MAG TPA: biotin/lipoyl-containing protein, partial [Terriglobales bacterium]|nr:biotin/lipoyl-containing protein [Terriglobales bacterium]